MPIHPTFRSPKRPSPARARRTGGFMLIEVLVSVLIFTVGVLALVGLQAALTQAEGASRTRAEAAFLANELIGTMWSDPANLSSYDGAACASYARCADWEDKVARTLPSGEAAIEVEDDFIVSVTLTWTPPDDTGEHSYSTTTSVRVADN